MKKHDRKRRARREAGREGPREKANKKRAEKLKSAVAKVIVPDLHIPRWEENGDADWTPPTDARP